MLKNAFSVGLKMWSGMAREVAPNGINVRIVAVVLTVVFVEINHKLSRTM